MKRYALLALFAVLLIALPAQAHNFAGTGDCDGWTLVLDGLYGATVITVDGNPVPLQLTHEIADTSAASSRSFVVFWDKPANDVTVTHTLYRQGECTPTTTVPVTTTTTPNVTTTTQPEVTTTTAQVTTTTGQTTTTQPETTTTTPNQTTTTINTDTPPTTTPAPTTTVPFDSVPTTTAPFFDTTTTAGHGTPATTEATLPFTGPSVDPAMLGAVASLTLGLGLIALGRSGRRREG